MLWERFYYVTSSNRDQSNTYAILGPVRKRDLPQGVVSSRFRFRLLRVSNEQIGNAKLRAGITPFTQK